MTICLADYELGAKFEGKYRDTLEALQHRLATILVAHIVHRKSSIILFEGWDAAGKGGAIQRLTAKLDPRAFRVWPIKAPTEEEKARHFLWRFWTRLPAKGEIAIFDRSWYGRVLVERVEGLAAEAEWRRGYDEINAFEAQQRREGTNVVKLFFHITQEVQDERLKARLHHPWKRWKVTEEDFRNRSRRDAYIAAVEEMIAMTSTQETPWHVIDGNNKKAARIAALTLVAERLAERLPMEPPAADAKIDALARGALGKDP